LASVLGVTGLTFLVWWSNSIATEFLLRHREGARKPWPMLATFATIFVGNVVFGI
jgi:apolipoprotein N-acyltransferase